MTTTTHPRTAESGATNRLNASFDAFSRRAGIDPDRVRGVTLPATQQIMVEALVARAKLVHTENRHPTYPPTMHSAKIVTLCGGAGTGKTHLMMATALAMLHAEIPRSAMMYRHESDLIAPPNGSQFEESPWKTAKAASVLFLDELGRGQYPNTSAGHSPLQKFLEWVMVSNIVVVAATNLPDVDTLKRAYPEHIASRLSASLTELKVGASTNGVVNDFRQGNNPNP